MILANSTLIAHWFNFFFWGGEHGLVWYKHAVWGNVVAVLPLAVLAAGGFFWHKGVVEEEHKKLDALAKKHDKNAEHLKKIWDLVNPEADGGLTIHFEKIEDLLNLDTPTGLKIILDAIKSKNSDTDKN